MAISKTLKKKGCMRARSTRFDNPLSRQQRRQCEPKPTERVRTIMVKKRPATASGIATPLSDSDSL